MQGKKARTFEDLTAEELLNFKKTFILIASAIEVRTNVRIKKILIEDSGGTLAVGIERLEPEGGASDEDDGLHV